MGPIRKTMSVTTFGIVPFRSKKEKLRKAERARDEAERELAREQAARSTAESRIAAAEKRVRVAGVFPAGSHPEIRYPVAAVAASANPQAARRLLAHLRSAQAAAVFARHGFIPIR